MDPQVTPEGSGISLRELGFFNRGQAELNPGASAKTIATAKILAKPGLDIRANGHSENQPVLRPWVATVQARITSRKQIVRLGNNIRARQCSAEVELLRV